MDSNFQKLRNYRLLDIDDLMILKMIGEGCSYKEIRILLGVTPPAISHRLRKYGQVWDGFEIPKPVSYNGVRVLGEETRKITAMASKVLGSLLSELGQLSMVDPK